MKKILNATGRALDQSLSGLVAAHPDIVAAGESGRFITRKLPKADGKVALISGGGSGHEPLHAGFVGTGMLDAACPGEVFTSPTPDQMTAAAAAVERGAGVLFIVKNYAGDVMNFEMAADMAGTDTATVITDDDVALLDSPGAAQQGSRGVAGTVVVEKIVGAAAERGAGLAECAALGKQINAATGSMAVALSSCTVPAAGQPTFSLGDDEMELGVGIHGEAGRERVKMQSADQLAEVFLTSILRKIGATADTTKPLLLFCNGLGGTPLMELYILYNSAAQILKKSGHTIARSLVGNYCTSLEMAGASLTVTRLNDDHLPLWDDPVNTAALRWGC